MFSVGGTSPTRQQQQLSPLRASRMTSASSNPAAARKLVDVNNVRNVELPHHLQRCLAQLRTTAEALGDTTRNLHTLTQGELFTADKKARVLVQSQRDTLRDLTFFCEREIRFLTSKAADVACVESSSRARRESHSASVEKSPRQQQRRPQEITCGNVGCASLYAALTATARSHGATNGAVFAVTTSDTLDLLALVRSQPIDAVTCGVESDIFRTCEVVAKLKCAVNLLPIDDADGFNRPQQQESAAGAPSLLAAPIYSPASPSLVMGVVAMWRKIAAPGSPHKGFSKQDEAACERLAAQAAQLISLFSLAGSSPSSANRMSPLSWEETWRSGTSLPTVLSAAPVNPPPRRFVFRHDGVKAATVAEQAQKNDTSVRHVIDSVSAFEDLSHYAEHLQRQVRELQAELAAVRLDIAEASKEKLESQAQAETALRCANTMRIANERLLRNTFVQRLPQDDVMTASAAELVAPVRQGYTFIASPPAALRDSAGRTGPKSAKRSAPLLRYSTQ